MKLHRKIKHNEKVCRAHDLGQGHNRVRGQIVPKIMLLINNTKANLLKLHRKIKDNEKVCQAQDICFCAHC